MGGDPRVARPARVSEQVPGRGDRGRERVPLGERTQPARHRGRRDERVGQETHGPHQDLQSHHRLRAAGDQTEVDAHPQHGQPQQQQESEGGQRRGESPVGLPAGGQARGCQRGQGDDAAQQVRARAADDHRRPRHGERAEPVGDTAREVGVHRRERGLDAEHHGQCEDAGNEELPVVARDRHRASEQEAEHQQHHHGEQQIGHQHPGLVGPVGEVAARHRPRVHDGPAQPRDRRGGRLGGAGR